MSTFDGATSGIGAHVKTGVIEEQFKKKLIEPENNQVTFPNSVFNPNNETIAFGNVSNDGDSGGFQA